MRRISILLLTLAMALAIALPVAAKGKPDMPSPDPTLYNVTLTLADDAEGLGTCDEHPLVMNDIDGALLADGSRETSVPRLWLRAIVPWSRTEPSSVTGDEFDGCHGGALAGSESDIPSYFIIHADRSDHVAGVLWAFDVYVEEGTKGKDETPGVKEYFRLWSTDEVSFEDASGNRCPLNPTEPVTCLVSGPFEIWHYYPIKQIGTANFEFILTIDPG
jgi:hypothetical protein